MGEYCEGSWVPPAYCYWFVGVKNFEEVAEWAHKCNRLLFYLDLLFYAIWAQSGNPLCSHEQSVILVSRSHVCECHVDTSLCHFMWLTTLWFGWNVDVLLFWFPGWYGVTVPLSFTFAALTNRVYLPKMAAFAWVRSDCTIKWATFVLISMYWNAYLRGLSYGYFYLI